MMDVENFPAKKRKVPIWVWAVAGIAVLVIIGGLFGSSDSSTTDTTAEPSVVAETSPAQETTAVAETTGASEEGTSVEAETFAIETVKERYETDCFANLGDDSVYRYEISPEASREGYVYVSVGGDVLQFAVGLNSKTGAFLTVPSDDLTVDKLTEAGC